MAAAMMAVIVAVTIGAGYVGSAVIARHRAQAAADLAALAAAVALPGGITAACGQASAVARAMRTAMTSCTADSLDVVVTVAASLTFALPGLGPAHAAARAGPVSAGG